MDSNNTKDLNNNDDILDKQNCNNDSKKEDKTISNDNITDENITASQNLEQELSTSNETPIEETHSSIENISEEKSEKAEDIKKSETPTTNIEQPIPNTSLINKEKEHKIQKATKTKNSLVKLIVFLTILAFIIIFSTIFAIISSFSNTIAKGIYIKNINVSGLTIDEATEKLSTCLNSELLPSANLIYNDITYQTLLPSDIDYKYDINSAIQKAYDIGKNNNLLLNNFDLLKCLFIHENIDIPYTYNETFITTSLNNLLSELPNTVIQPSYNIENDKLIIYPGTSGLTINLDKTRNNILNNFYNRNYQELKNYNNNIKIDAIHTEPNKINIKNIYNEIVCEPQNAYYSSEPFALYPEKDGIDFAITLDEAQKLIDSSNGTDITIPLKLTPATLTINDIGVEAFPYQISTYSTKYDASNINRSGNLSLAASKINGKVIMPGDTFSFNEIVGKRTIEDGYRNAKIYQNGQVVDGLAGGICQISSTLYNAVLLANLEIVERYNHSFTSSYVPAGRDATVVYGTKDFKFKNTRNYPIKLEAIVEKGTATFIIHGIQEETEYEINIVPVTTSYIPYTVVYNPNPALAPGQQIITQSGHSGCRVTTYIERRLNGTLVSKEIISNDIYNAMNTIVETGP